MFPQKYGESNQISAPKQQSYSGHSYQNYRDPLLDLPNNCKIGYVQPIWEGDAITETYCRCPDGSYGHNCQEGYKNPCDGYSQYHPADSRLHNKYFIECSWNIPYLMKCPRGTVWNQNILSCDWTTDATHDTYGGYQNNRVQQSQSSYQPPVQQPSYQPPVQKPPVKQPSYQPPVQKPPVKQPSYQLPVQQPSYQPPVKQPSYQQPVQQPSY